MRRFRAAAALIGTLGVPEELDPEILFSVEFSTPGTTLPTGSRGEQLQFSRNSAASFYVDGVEVVAAVNQPRIVREGLLGEPACTNLLADNNDLSAAGWYGLWSAPGPAVLSGVSRDGDRYGRITRGSAAGVQQIGHNVTTTGAVTISAHVAKVTGGGQRYVSICDNAGVNAKGVFDLQTGAVAGNSYSSCEVEDLGDEWRISLYCNRALNGLIAIGMTDSMSLVIGGAGDTSKWIDVRRVQVEANGYATRWTANSRAAELCWVICNFAIGTEYCIEVEYIPAGGGYNNRTQTRGPIVEVGNHASAPALGCDLVGSVGYGLLRFAVTAGGDRHVDSPSINTAAYWTGTRVVACASDGVARPTIFVDSRETSVAPSGTGTGVFSAVTPQQQKIWIGCASDGVSGGVIVRKLIVRKVRRPSLSLLGAFYYSQPKNRGHVPDANVFAALGDSNTDGLAIGAAITEAWPHAAARTKGQLWAAHNFGVGSTSTAHCHARWLEQIKGRGYRTLVYQAGINDANAGAGAVAIASQIEATLLDASKSGVSKIIVVNMMPGSDAVGDSAYLAKTGANALIAAFCAAHGWELVDAWSIFTNGSPTAPAISRAPIDYDYDGNSLHLSQLGFNRLGTEVATKL